MKNLKGINSIVALVGVVMMTLCSLSSIGQNANNAQQQDLNEALKPLKYRCIGPFRGGRSVCASGVIGDPITYYMGTTGGGLWKTKDAGQHWSNISDGYFKTGSVGAVAVSESDPNIVYCGMGEHAPRAVMTSHGDGVYKSTDAGKTWKHLGLTKTQHISRIIIHPKNPDIVFVAAQGALYGPNQERGIYKSIDGGQNWKQVLFVNNLTGCSELSIDHHNPNVLYSAMWEHQRQPWKVISGGKGSGLYKSSDGGETWQEMENGLPEEMGKMAIAVSRANPEKVYALIESDWDEEKGGLYVSNNAGDSWSQVSKDHRLIQRSWYYIEVFADPNNEHTLYVLSAPALRSIDGGKTWERLSGTHGDYHDLWINPDNSDNMVIANDGGAAISFNFADSWSTQANMATAQFYRVTVDNLYPYNIYGGQQDNSSVKIASKALGSRGISERNWSASAGGESAFLAFDPDNPTHVMGGSYLGTIELLDVEADAGTQIMSAPIQYLGMEAREMKYLYNWNAPIIWSQHEPGTWYHGAQYLLRTKDNGQSWTEASPDLTRNQDDKQGNGGGPYTNEAVGAENYGTLSYVIESPHEKGVIWTGSDDGFVQLTRDNCATWTNVTPKGLEECLINAIEVSPHDPATAYIATTRYKFDDKTPALYKTADYGKTWVNISNGIPLGSYTRVVREDHGQKDLLFAGTETGVYISWNGGQNWTALQLNLPVTPILDMIVKHDDLILATSGRSFWILDDIGFLRQYKTDNSGLKLYAPEDIVLANGGSELDGNSSSFDGTHHSRGVNPATGVVIYYSLPDDKGNENGSSNDGDKIFSLEILDENQQTIQRYVSKKDSTYRRWDGGPPPAQTISKNAGLNRFVWNLRHANMPGVEDTYIEGGYRGHQVGPGKYAARLTHGDDVQMINFNIKPNPKYPSDLDYEEYDQWMSEMESNLTEMHNLTNELFGKRKKLASLIYSMADDEESMSIKIEGKKLLADMKKWDEEMVQRKSKAYDDVENFPNKFTANYLFLINATDSDIPRINQGTKDRRAELDAQWKTLKERGDNIVREEIPAFNKLLWEKGYGAIH